MKSDRAIRVFSMVYSLCQVAMEIATIALAWAWFGWRGALVVFMALWVSGAKVSKKQAVLKYAMGMTE
jgi:hypothetical protein